MWHVNNFFQLECLQAHNRFRALHGCPPLQLNKHLTEFASNWAQKLGELNTLEHTNVKVFGENIFMAEGMEINGESPARFWYKERKNYNAKEAKYSENSSNFTQLVWKESSQLGVGGCMIGDVSIVVTHYHPPGNVEGKFEKNVPPLIFEETLEQRRLRLLQQQEWQKQQQRLYCQKLLEYHRRKRFLEQQKLLDKRRKQKQEQHKKKQNLEDGAYKNSKLQPTSYHILDKTSGFSSRLPYYGLALIAVAALVAYGAYKYSS